MGQHQTDGATPSGLAPGAPESSYALSGFDNVNLFNGHLNFQLPLLSVGGRGSVGYQMTLPIEQTWTIWKQTNEITHVVSYHPEPNWWDGIKPGFSPGVIQGRRGGYGSVFCGQNSPWYRYSSTLTRLTFTAADGTEFELRDQLTGGQPRSPVNCTTGFNRGRVFVTADGSSATFISDADISDTVIVSEDADIVTPSGYLLLRDGTRYRFDGGSVTWMRDRNGNKLSFSYGPPDVITDSLGRQITITYATSTPGSTVISYKGFGGQVDRTISVNYDYLENALRTGYSKQTYQQLFPELYGSSSTYYNPVVVKSVTLPNTKQYQLFYNPYGEVARAVLPTGGAIEYDYMAGEIDGYADGVIGTGYLGKAVYRRVVERREYPDGSSGSSYASKMTYSRPESSTTNAGYVVTDQCTPSGTTGQCGGAPYLLARQYHYFYGSSISSFYQRPTDYSAWNEGKEYQTDSYAADGATLLRRVVNAFAQRAAVSWWTGDPNYAPPNDPRLVETDTTLADTNQVTKQTFGYSNDLHNNQTDVYEYDYGVGGAPTYPTRHTHTDYLVVNSVNGVNYADPANGSTYAATDIHIRNLPRAQQVYSVNPQTGAETLVAQGETRYDEGSLTTYSSVAGWDDPGGARGLATTSRKWIDTSNSWLEAHAAYDQAGNVVSATDARGITSYISYADSFSDGVGRNTYAFPTSTTSAVPDPTNVRATNTPLTTSTVYDYWTRQVYSSTDANGKTTTAQYNDPLERLTRVDRPDGGWTTYNYGTSVSAGLTSDYVRTVTSLDASHSVESYQFFDGLGRKSRTFLNVGGSPVTFSTTDTQYDALGRAWRVSNPYYTGGSADAINPSGRWTTSGYDALGRVLSVTTPDGAAVNTSYSGNTVTVTDQAGKQRRSVSDALGRLAQVVEDPNGSAYATNYTYDALGNLRKVDQGGQLRFFMYDSLSRLIRAKNPEQAAGSVASNITDPITGNSQWSMAYGYDADGNLYQRVDARDVWTTYEYDNLNRLIHTSYTDGTPFTFLTYDFATNGRGRFYADYESSLTGTLNFVTAYDAAGRPTSRFTQFYVNGSGWTPSYTSTRAYDLAGNVLSETYPSGHTVTNAYDAAGRLSSFSGNLGDGVARTYSSGVQYDEASRLQQEQFGTQTPLYHKLHYNSRGQLYDIRLSTVPWATDPLNWNRGCLAFYYDSGYHWGGQGGQDSGPDNNGNVVRSQHWVPGDDQMSTYNLEDDVYYYDALNRISSMNEFTQGTYIPQQQTGAQVYSYDRWGNRTISAAGTWGNGINNKQFTVDTSTNRFTNAGMQYDAAGNLWQDTYSGHAAQRSYDAENRMTMEQSSLDSTFDYYTYDAAGKRVRRNVAGSVTWQFYGFDDELVGEYAQNAASIVPQKEYGYRGGELLVTAEGTSSTSAQDWVWVEDSIPAGASTSSGGWNEPWNWITSSPSPASGSSSDQMQVNAGLHQQYFEQAPQNMVVNSGENLVAYVYLDPANMPSEIMLQWEDGITGWDHRAYWGANNIAWGTDATVSRRYMGSLPAAGQWVRLEVPAAAVGLEGRSVHGMAVTLYGGRATWDRLGKTSLAGPQWIVSDQIGTPRMIADKTGSLAGIKRHDYLPFGEELGAGTSGRTSGTGYAADNIRQKFAGVERDDETGFDFMQARFYSSTMGRFASPDEPLLDQDTINPQSWNLYSYVRNSPLSFTDPTGLAHFDKKGNYVGDYDGEFSSDLGLYWNAEKQYWESKEEYKKRTRAKALAASSVLVLSPELLSSPSLAPLVPAIGGAVGVCGTAGCVVLFLTQGPTVVPLPNGPNSAVNAAPLPLPIPGNSATNANINPNIFNKSKHNKDVVDGLIKSATTELNKLLNDPPGPGGPQNHHKNEIKAILERAKRIASRLKGQAREAAEQAIRAIEEAAERH